MEDDRVLLRSFTCAVCGGPRRILESSTIIVLCSHCGAILTHSAEGIWRDAASVSEWHAKGIRQIVRPTTAQARLLRLSVDMQAIVSSSASVTDDPNARERWRLCAEEQILLTAITHPELVAPLPEEPRARAKYVADAVAVQEIATFDTKISGLMSAYGSTCSDLTRAPDPIHVASRMLVAARAYWSALASHPDLPPGMFREGADHHARSMVRTGIAGSASLLGAGVIERIRTEVLGDVIVIAAADVVRCPKCGAPIDRGDDRKNALVRCPHCAAVTAIDEDDAWTAARLAIWRLSLDELARNNQLDGMTPVIAAIGGFLHTAAVDVPIPKAVRFLERAIPWITKSDLDSGLDILTHGANPTQRALLDGIRSATGDWKSDPTLRPSVPEPAPASSFAPPSPEEEAAWIESALALWTMRPGTLLDLLGHPLVTLHLAAMRGEPCGVSARAAVTFFHRAMANKGGGWSPTAMRAEVLRIQGAGAYDHPRLAAFTAELLRLLQD